ncbi:MAG TPA: hypothetical protein VF945_17055, partial [Polyangia bacterium]
APVFTFGNWPHPRGVVPAHQTIAASLYYLPMLNAAAAVRPPDAPPVFVLDANRLASYRDADAQFDNRYFVKLPTAEQLAALGVRHVLYVGADAHELDDLNAALVALCQRGVDVKMVALGDFVRAGDEPAQLAEGEGGDEADDGDEGDEPAGYDPAWSWGFAWAHSPVWWPHFWYRGCWWHGGLFWGDYGFYQPPHGRTIIIPRHRGAVVVGPPLGKRMPIMPTRAAWTPTARATMFTPVIGAPARPSFGQVAVRAARSDGHIISMQGGLGHYSYRSSAVNSVLGNATPGHPGASNGHGGAIARSGSLGRAGTSGFGGG